MQQNPLFAYDVQICYNVQNYSSNALKLCTLDIISQKHDIDSL